MCHWLRERRFGLKWFLLNSTHHPWESVLVTKASQYSCNNILNKRGHNIHRGWLECIRWGNTLWLPRIIKFYRIKLAATYSSLSSNKGAHVKQQITSLRQTDSPAFRLMKPAFTTLPPSSTLHSPCLLSLSHIYHTCSHLLTTRSIDLN